MARAPPAAVTGLRRAGARATTSAKPGSKYGAEFVQSFMRREPATALRWIVLIGVLGGIVKAGTYVVMKDSLDKIERANDAKAKDTHAAIQQHLRTDLDWGRIWERVAEQEQLVRDLETRSVRSCDVPQ